MFSRRYDVLPVPEEQSHELLGCGVEEALTCIVLPLLIEQNSPTVGHELTMGHRRPGSSDIKEKSR